MLLPVVLFQNLCINSHCFSNMEGFFPGTIDSIIHTHTDTDCYSIFSDLLFSLLFGFSGEPDLSKAAGQLLVCIFSVACCDEEDITVSPLTGDFHFAN